MYNAHVRRRLPVRPGITGRWQVSEQSDLSWEDSSRLDLSHVENWSMFLRPGDRRQESPVGRQRHRGLLVATSAANPCGASALVSLSGAWQVIPASSRHAGITFGIRVQCCGQRVERTRVRAMVDMHPAAPRFDESGLAQLSEVVADGRLGQPDRVREYAATFLTPRGGEQHREQLDPDRVAKHPEAKRNVYRGDVADESRCDRPAMQASCSVDG